MLSSKYKPETAISSSAPQTQRLPLLSVMFNARAGSATVRHSEADATLESSRTTMKATILCKVRTKTLAS